MCKLNSPDSTINRQIVVLAGKMHGIVSAGICGIFVRPSLQEGVSNSNTGVQRGAQEGRHL